MTDGKLRYCSGNLDSIKRGNGYFCYEMDDISSFVGSKKNARNREGILFAFVCCKEFCDAKISFVGWASIAPPLGQYALRLQSASPPPSTTRAAPVMKEESSEARNNAAFAISSVVPIRPRGRLAHPAR